MQVYLPEVMNFSSECDITIAYMNLIRQLASKRGKNFPGRLESVNFNGLRKISSSAALVLTAEMSKWDDSCAYCLKPRFEEWSPEIVRKFYELGYFNLFKGGPKESYFENKDFDVSLIKYIKQSTSAESKIRVLKTRLKSDLQSIIGDSIEKWTFLHSGLSEAVTNVTHHAYPQPASFLSRDRNWYLTGAFSSRTNELKVVFYDQGVGIPKSLPKSKMWERAIGYIAELGVDFADRHADSVLLKAAVEMSRTRTDDEDRGKGLQDLLQFIRMYRDGYLSILSRRGLYKFSCENGTEKIKSDRFEYPIEGTLIIWRVQLKG
ncbi:hypothetical protein [Simiduia curdlanivorans]|uniref:hypothetical protein n=1 Tax=Simiduia curdlanivorans TaxID=1492769 RepID=UPI0025B3ED17|nr:hypothetical protein [Simiduia curdlanivorans]